MERKCYDYFYLFLGLLHVYFVICDFGPGSQGPDLGGLGATNKTRLLNGLGSGNGYWRKGQV